MSACTDPMKRPTRAVVAGALLGLFGLQMTVIETLPVEPLF